MTRATDDQIARLLQLDPSETGAGFNAPMLDMREDWHENQGRDRDRMVADVDALSWFGRWAWRIIVAASTVALAGAFWQAWGAQ